MEQVRRGDNVKVHYSGILADGTVFDSSVGREPLSLTVGSGQVIAGFDEALMGMEVGEKKTVFIPVDKAYGARNEEMVMEVPIEQVPPDLNPEIGTRLELGGMNGELIRVVVTAVTKTHITLDANPPLAGKDLTFTIEVLECASP
jgi:peptidylprolyl isomerase